MNNNNSPQDQQLVKDIDDFIQQHMMRSQKFSVRHHLTRRLETLSSVMVVFGLLVSSSRHIDKLLVLLKPENGQPDQPDGAVFYVLSAVVLMFVLIFIIVERCSRPVDKNDGLDVVAQHVKNKIANNDHFIWSLSWALIACLLVYKPIDLASGMMFWGILIFVGSYSTNRKYGYTRGFSRNRFYGQQAEILLDEVKYDMDANLTIRQKLNDLKVASQSDTHKDIVGDYIEYGNSALKWFSNRKIK